MHKTIQEWVISLDQLALPVLQAAHQSLAALESSGSDVSGAQVARCVLPDPMMVLRAMRMANSGRRGRFAQPVLTVEHAVMMNGLSASFSKLMAAPVVDETLAPNVRAGLFAVAARASHAAVQARDWAFLRLDMNVEEVYIAALLQELAAMLLWVAAPEEMTALNARYRHLSRDEAEQETFGFTLDSLSLALAQDWNLPPLIVAALQQGECEAHVRPRLVSIARKLARDVAYGWYGEASLRDIEDLAEALKLTVDDATARVHRVAVEAARTRPFEGVEPAARWLPLLPGAWLDEDAQDAATVAPDPYQAAMAQIGAHLDGTMSLHDLMLLVLKGMRDGIGLKRVVFALLTQDKAQLRARFVVGAADGSPLKQFQSDLRTPHLFSKLMEKQQAFWLNDDTRAKVQPLIGSDISQLTDGQPFFAMSVAVHGKMIGLFYADGDRHPLDAGHYDKFKKLCTQAATGMAHLARGAAQ